MAALIVMMIVETCQFFQVKVGHVGGFEPVAGWVFTNKFLEVFNKVRLIIEA